MTAFKTIVSLALIKQTQNITSPLIELWYYQTIWNVHLIQTTWLCH